MKINAILGVATFAKFAAADTNAEVQLLTAIVSDYSSHKDQYINYFLTGGSLPPGLTQLALKVATYTDDSYTTLVDDSSIDFAPLVSFATALPWYTRIEAGGISGVDAPGVSTTKDTSSRSLSSSGEGISPVVPIGAIVGMAALILM